MNLRFPPALLVIVSMVFAACGGGTSESGFDADPAPIAADLVPALADVDDAEAVPELERNFLEACVKGGDESLPRDLPAVQRDGLLAVCGCTYNALVQFSFSTADDGDSEAGSLTEDELNAAAFARFSELDDDVLADGEVPTEVAALVRACIRTEAGI